MSGTGEVDVSVVIGFKDWGVDRLRLAVETLNTSFGELRGEVIVSDYGSTTCPEVREVVEAAGGRHVYTTTDGIWSRSRALNAGFVASTGRVLVTTDADMLFSPRAMERVGRRVLQDPAEGVVLQCRDLPTGMGSEWVAEHGTRWEVFAESATLRPRWGMGGMMAVAREAFLDVRGFDERMQIYGGEDLDFAQRIRRAGRRISWIEDPEVRMYHMWHPSSRTAASETPEGLAAIEYNRDILLKDLSVIRNTERWRHRPADAPPVASVVIATRNRAPLLRESIHSALAQTVRDIEVLVVDDSSEDDTRAVVEGIDDPRLRYLQSPRRGIAAARNYAATQCRARYTVVHDDDDLMMPDRIKHHLAALQAGDSGTYGGWVDFSDATGEVVSVNRGRPYSLAALLFSEGVYLHPTLMLETRLVREIGYDERFRSGSDYNLAVRLARLGIHLRHTGHIHLVRRLHTRQVTHQDSSTQQSAGRWTTAAALGLIPDDRQASVRAATRQIPPVDLGLEDGAAAETIRPYLPDRFIVRDLHLVLDEGVAPESVPQLEATITVEDLLHENRPDVVCGILPSATWADLASASGRAAWSVVRSRQGRDGGAARVAIDPVEHLRLLSMHLLESMPAGRGALVIGHSDLVDRESSYLLGHWRAGDDEMYLVSLPAGQELVDSLRRSRDHEVRVIELRFPPDSKANVPARSAVPRVSAPPPAPMRPVPGRKQAGGGAPAKRPAATGRKQAGGGAPVRPPAGRPTPPTAEPKRRLFTRRRLLLAAVVCMPFLGGMVAAILVGGVVTVAVVIAGLWLAGMTAGLLLMQLRVLDAGRRTEEMGHGLMRRLGRVLEGQTRLERRTTQLDKRTIQLDKRTIQLDKRTGELPGAVLALDKQIDELGTSLSAIDERVGAVDERVGRLEGPLADLGGRVAKTLQEQQALRETAAAIPGVVERQTLLQLRHHLDQVQALVNLFQLVSVRSAAPQLGGWAASAEVLLRVVDEMLTNRPKLVVECGSGASTVWLAMVVRELGLPTRIVALEHHEGFAAATRKQLEHHGVTDHAEVRLAPLADVAELPDHPTPWYDVAAVADLEDIGLLFVDGPPKDTGHLARLPAVPLLRKRLAEICTIVLDDHNRPEEQAVAERWRELLNDFDYEVLAGDKGAAVLTRQARS